MKIRVTADKIEIARERDSEPAAVRLYTRLAQDDHNAKPVGYAMIGTYHAEHSQVFRQAKLSNEIVDHAAKVVNDYLRKANDSSYAPVDLVTALNKMIALHRMVANDLQIAKVQLKGEQEARQKDEALRIRALQDEEAARKKAESEGVRLREEVRQLQRENKGLEDALDYSRRERELAHQRISELNVALTSTLDTFALTRLVTRPHIKPPQVARSENAVNCAP